MDSTAFLTGIRDFRFGQPKLYHAVQARKEAQHVVIEGRVLEI